MAEGVLVFGEVLFDRFPDGRVVLGGAPFNVAWHLQAFGLAPVFVSRIGEDELGAKVRWAMLNWGMDTSGLQLDPKRETGAVDVEFRDEEPHYTIVPDRAFDCIDADSLPEFGSDSILYHGTLGVRNFESEQALQEMYRRLFEEGTQPKVFVDANLRAPWWNLDRTWELMKQARWLKVSEEELLELVPEGRSLSDRIAQLMFSLPLEALIVTRGKKGAIAASTEGALYELAPEEKIVEVVDTVGAGDAFCSVLLLGITQGWPLELSMQRAQAFAEAIVGIRGATTGDRGVYEGFLGQWSP